MKLIIKLFFFGMLISFVACHHTGKKFTEKDFAPEMVRFTPFQGNPVFSGTNADTWDRKIRERGFIMYENGLYKMWYSGYNTDMTPQKSLGYATSQDGINWTRYSDKPIFSERWTEDMYVVKQGGTYYMVAEGAKDIAHLLVSPDGISWRDRGDLIILTAKGDTVRGPYGTPVLWIEDGKWYLFYERNDMGVWLAGSKDKITWKNMQDKPVLIPGPLKYDMGAVAADQVVKHKGNYYMYYHATDRSDWNHPSSPVIWTSEVAMSSDLIHWTKYPGNPFVKGDHSSPILVFDGSRPSLYTVHSEICRYSPE